MMIEQAIREHFSLSRQSWTSRADVLAALHIPHTHRALVTIDRILVQQIGLTKSIRNKQYGYQGIATDPINA